jgi:hypothetical protein
MEYLITNGTIATTAGVFGPGDIIELSRTQAQQLSRQLDMDEQPLEDIGDESAPFELPVLNEFSPVSDHRLVQLWRLYEKEGYQPIKTIATEHGISRPDGGSWADVIPLIVEAES